MSKKTTAAASHFASHSTLVSHVRSQKLGHVDAREWKEEWSEKWVVFADLIAFASRSKRSDAVVLNNIIRFDRASTLVGAEMPGVRVHRFSDATFACAATFHDALAFATAISHACLAFNQEYLLRGVKPFFIHLIAPKITIARGSVLQLPDTPTVKAHQSGLEPRNIIAGSAIVRAYELERASAGGLVTIDKDGIDALTKLDVRGDTGRVANALRRWIGELQNRASGKAGEVLFCRGELVDLPWLLLRPLQNDPRAVWGATRDDGDAAIASYLDMWDKSIREYYSPQNSGAPLDIAKHYQAATRHGVQSYHAAHGEHKPRYQSVTDLL